MAINQNHPFEELDGVKCAVVERNVMPERVEFLRTLLEHNKFQVVVIPSPPPKAAAKPAATAEGEPAPEPSNFQPPAISCLWNIRRCIHWARAGVWRMY
jgi:hypothetical protein